MIKSQLSHCGGFGRRHLQCIWRLLLCFTCDMGAFGAGLATAIGAVISIIVMLSHFFMKKNTLRLVRPANLFRKLRKISVTGFSTFFVDIAMGILTILFNRQIMAYLGTDALSIYGVIVYISTFVQCCAYSVGQASQPIISTNFGAGNGKRIRRHCGMPLEQQPFSALSGQYFALPFQTSLSIFLCRLRQKSCRLPPAIIRCYGLSFLLMPLNIFSAYYFQALMKPKAAFVVSISRGLIISGILILLLPIITGANSIWVCYASYRTAYSNLCRAYDCPLYKTIITRKTRIP